MNLLTQGRSGIKPNLVVGHTAPAPPLGEGPTWAEATAEMRRKVILEKDAPTLEEVIHDSPQKKTEKKDSDWDEDT